jgi:hypothetical protein
MVGRHNSGLVLLNKLVLLSITIVVVVVFKVLVEVMKLLLWVLPFVWVLTTIEVVIWPKRAMASLHIIHLIKLLLLRSLNHRIKVFRHMIMDSVHLLIPILITLDPQIGAEAIQISEAEVAVIISILVAVATTIVIKMVVKDQLQRISISLQVQMLMARKRRSVA